MKIKYIHISDPEAERVHDTERAMRNNMGMIRAFGGNPSQEVWDRFELEKFEQDKEKGLILRYEVLEEGQV